MRAIVLLCIYYGCVVYALVNPVFGLLFFIHITILRPESLVWGNLMFGRLHLFTGLSVLIGYLVHQKFRKGILDENYQKVNIRVFVFFVCWLFIVSILAEESVDLSLDKAIEVLKVCTVCYLFAKLVTTEWRFQAYIWVISVSFGLLGFWGTLQGLAGNPRLDTLWPGGSNYIAAQFALIAPFTFTKLFDAGVSFRCKVILVICAASMITCSIYTDSRGGALGLGIGMLMCVVHLKQRVKALTTILVMAALLVPLVPAYYSDRIASIFGEKEERDESASSRPVLWEIALRIWSDHPIAGVGLENFSPVKESYADKVSDIVPSSEMHALIFGRPRYPHGLYPGMMAETGIVGLLLYLILLLRNMLCRFPNVCLKTDSHYLLYQQARGAQAGLIGFATAAVFGDFQYIETFYLQLFFVGAVRGYADSSIREKC